MVKCIYGEMSHKAILRKVYEMHQQTNAFRQYRRNVRQQLPEPFLGGTQ